MDITMRHLLFAAAICCATLYAIPVCAAEPELQQSVAAFLNSYAAGDKAAVLAAVEPDVKLYGSDVAEIYSGSDGAAKMFDGDMMLWGKTAKFGDMRDVSTAREGNLESIFFDAPFSVGGRAPVTVRFAMVWRLDGDVWKLVQSSNAVPTVGQTAADILKGAH